MTHPQRRIQNIIDEKMLWIKLDEFDLELPSEDIFDEPLRCIKVNKSWFKIISGFISLGQEEAVWKDAQDEGYSGIRQITKLLQGMNCMDCTDVVDCMEDIIANLQSQINALSGSGGGSMQTPTILTATLSANWTNNSGGWQSNTQTQATLTPKSEDYLIYATAYVGNSNSLDGNAQLRIMSSGGNFFSKPTGGITSGHDQMGSTWLYLTGLTIDQNVTLSLDFEDNNNIPLIYASEPIVYYCFPLTDTLTDLQEIWDAIDAIVIVNNAQNSQITTLQGNIASLQNSITTLNNSINAINTTILSLQSQISSNDADILSLQIQDSLINASISDINDQLSVLNVWKTLTDASISSLQTQIDECCDDPEPEHVIDPLVTFDDGTDQFVLTEENIGVISTGGNPNNCLYTQSADFFEQIAVEIDLGVPKEIQSISLDAFTDNQDGCAIGVFVDGNQVGAQRNQSLNNSWQTELFDEGFPVTGQVVKVRYIVSTAETDNIMAIDNIFVDTGGV